MAHWRRRGRRLRTIKGPTYGRLACRPAAHKRLWTVLARTAPLPPTTWRLAVAVTNLFRRWICLMSPSCLPVVTWGYPVWGWSEVDPVIARRFTNLLTVDGRQSSCLATSFSERLPKSIPTDLFDKHWHLIHCNAGVQTENCYVFQVGTSSNLPNAKRMMKFCLNLGRQEQKGVFLHNARANPNVYRKRDKFSVIEISVPSRYHITPSFKAKALFSNENSSIKSVAFLK